MPALSLDSLIRGSVYNVEKRNSVTSSRPSYSSHDRYSSSNGDRETSNTHSHPHGVENPSREKQWVQNSNSTKCAVDTTPDFPPPAYSETAKATLPTPRPRSVSISTQGPSVPSISTLPRLQLPVVIPQNPRDGGFCRAYTPLLEECQVSETAFFYFLDDFDRSAQASPYFSAVNIASIGSLNRPHSTAMIVTLAKKQINTFIDRVNEEFFQPRSLFCLIVTWRPDINKTHEIVNIEEPIFCSSTRSLPFPRTARLSFPLGDPTENIDPTRDLSMPNSMYGPGPTSPAYGRGAGIPRLAGAASFGYSDPYGYGGMGINQGYEMGYNQGYGMSMGGGRMAFGGMGMGGMGMGGMGMGGMGMGMGMGRMGGMGGMVGGFGMGGPLGLIAGLIEDKMASKSHSNPGYQGGPNGGYDPGSVARGPTKESDAKQFKKDAIYLMIVNLPSDDEMARFGTSC